MKCPVTIIVSICVDNISKSLKVRRVFERGKEVRELAKGPIGMLIAAVPLFQGIVVMATQPQVALGGPCTPSVGGENVSLGSHPSMK